MASLRTLPFSLCEGPTLHETLKTFWAAETERRDASETAPAGRMPELDVACVPRVAGRLRKCTLAAFHVRSDDLLLGLQPPGRGSSPRSTGPVELANK